MATTIYDLGSVMPVFKGLYSAETEYEKNNIVSYNNIAWVCNIDLNTTLKGETPSSSSANWLKVLEVTGAVGTINDASGDVVIPIAIDKDNNTVSTLLDTDSNPYKVASTDCVDDKIANATTVLQNYTNTAITNLLADFSLDLGKIYN